jgi:hypothetical protein
MNISSFDLFIGGTMFYTYLWLRENGTPYYVGKGSGRRAFQNRDHNVFRPERDARVFVQYWESEEKAFEMEMWYISLYGRKDLGTGILRNMTNGGDGPSGWVPSEETKAKISKALMGHVMSEESKKKNRDFRLGVKRNDSEEVRNRRIAAIKKAKHGLWRHGTINGYRRHKCRCILCKTAASTYRLKLKQQEK